MPTDQSGSRSTSREVPADRPLRPESEAKSA
jgi:hypothetical protein